MKNRIPRKLKKRIRRAEQVVIEIQKSLMNNERFAETLRNMYKTSITL